MAIMKSSLVVSLVNKFTAPARAVSRSMRALEDASKVNAHRMRAVQGQMLGAVGAAYALSRAIGAPVVAAMEFESAMADIRKVVDFETPEQFKAMSDDIIDLSRNLPIAATGIADIVAAAGQAGMRGDELLTFAEMAAKVGVAFDMSADQSGEALAKIKTSLNLSVSETGALADAVNHLTNNMASSAPDMINFMRRAGAVGQQYGFAAEQTAAIGSAMIAAGAEANVAATSFRNVGRALTKGAASTNAQRDAFRELGLSTTDVARRMQEDATGTLQDVLERVKALPREMQAATLSQLFGDEARALAPLVENLGLYEQALASVADQHAYLGSAEAEYAQRADTSANKMQLLRNRLEATGIAIGNALLPAIVALAEKIAPLIEAIGEFANAHPEVVAAVAGIAAGLVALKVATLGASFAFLFMKGGLISGTLGMVKAAGAIVGLLNPFALLKGSAIALRTVMMFSGVGIAVAAIAAAGLLIYNNWEGLVSFFKGFSSGLMAGLEPIMPVIQPIADAANSLMSSVMGMLGPIDATNQEWQAWGETIGGVVAGAISSVIGLIEKMVGGIMGAVRAAQEFGSAIARFWGGDDSGQAAPSGVQSRRENRARLAGQRAAGGPVKAGLTYMTGERGRELFTAPTDGYIHNAQDTARVLAGLQPALPTPPSQAIGRAINDNAANANQNPGPQSIVFGDIIVQGGANADPQMLANALGDEVGRRVRGAFTDGGQ